MKLFCVQDMAAGSFLPPFVDQTDGVACRRLRDVLVDNSSHAFAKHPSDYALWQVGEFDEFSGSVAPCVLRQVVNLAALVEVDNG